MATLLPLGVGLFMTKPLWLVKELNIQAPSANSTIGRRLIERAMAENEHLDDRRGGWTQRCNQEQTKSVYENDNISRRKKR